MSSSGRIVVLTAPSGSGKTTIARRLMQAVPGLSFSVSATTRPPRKGEVNGVDYHFLSPEAFRKRVNEGGLVEYEEVYPDRFYGTLRSTLDAASPLRPVLLDIDVKGALAVKSLYGDGALTIFIRPPDLEALEVRLRGRGLDSDKDIAVRLEKAALEIRDAALFDAVVLNDELDRAVDETIALVRSFLSGNQAHASE